MFRRITISHPLLFIAWSLIIALLGSWALVFAAGVPALQQDWNWPIHPAQCTALTSVGSTPWNSTAEGSPQAYPEAWWAYTTMGALCNAFGPERSVGFFVLGCLLLAGVSMFLLCLRFGAKPLGIFCAMTLYVLNPVVLNELQAGHLLFLFSYGLMPLLATTAMTQGRFQALFCGVLLGFGAAQQQFIVIGAILLALFLRSSSPAKWIGTYGVSVAIALLCTSPMWIIALIPGESGGLGVLHPTLHWEYAQSVQVSDAIRLLGYTGHYDERLLSEWLRIAWWVLPLTGAVIFLNRPAMRWTLAAAACVIIGVVVSAGLYGPASIPLARAFVTIPAFAFFRELYNFASLAAFGYAVLAAYIQTNDKPCSRTISLVLALPILACSILTGYRSSSGIPHYILSQRGYQLIDQISRRAGDDRFVVQPPTYPFRVVGTNTTGDIPLVAQIGNHPSANTALASFPAHYYALSDLNSMSRGGIGAILRVPNMEDGFWLSLEPVLQDVPRMVANVEPYNNWKLVSLSAAPRLEIQPYSSQPGTLAVRYPGTRSLAPLVGRAVDLVGATPILDPRRGWARTALWPVLPAWAYAVPSGVFTVTSRRSLRIDAGLVVAGDSAGSVRGRNCTTLRQLDEHFRILSCAKNPVLYGSKPIVVSEATIGGEIAATVPMRGDYGKVTILRSKSFALDATVEAKRGSAIVLHESYDPNWVISLGGTKHVRVDGYANAWVLPYDYNGRVSVRYAPAALFFILEYLSIACMVAAFGALLQQLALR